MKNKIRKQFLLAKKNGNKEEVTVLSTLLGEIDRIKPEIIDGVKIVKDVDIINTIKKMVENNKLTGTENENDYLIHYLPKMMSDDELELNINSIITIINAQSIKDMGMVMGKLKKDFGGQYDGKKASEIVKKLLK